MANARWATKSTIMAIADDDVGDNDGECEKGDEVDDDGDVSAPRSNA